MLLFFCGSSHLCHYYKDMMKGIYVCVCECVCMYISIICSLATDSTFQPISFIYLNQSPISTHIINTLIKTYVLGTLPSGRSFRPYRLIRANQKKTRYIVAHYRGKKAIIVAHNRISHPEKNYDRKNVIYCWSSLSRKKR